MFEKGHVFVYGETGVCRVEDIKICDYGTGKKEYYILQPVFDLRSSLSVPVDSPIFSSRAREILSKEEVLEIIDSLPDSDSEWIRDEKERLEAFKSLLDSGICKNTAILVRSLYLHKKDLLSKGKKLRSSDEALMQRAEKLLFGEFAWVLGINPNKVADFIKSRIN